VVLWLYTLGMSQLLLNMWCRALNFFFLGDNNSLLFGRRIGGIISVGGYVVLPHRYPKLLTTPHPSANASTPVLAIHGKLDPVVEPQFAQERYDILTKHNVPVEWRLKDELANHTTPDIMMEILSWATNQIKAATP
jgi:predicted esterase